MSHEQMFFAARVCTGAALLAALAFFVSAPAGTFSRLGASQSAAVWESQFTSYSGYPSPANCYDRLSSYPDDHNVPWAGPDCSNVTDTTNGGLHPPFYINAGVFNAHTDSLPGQTKKLRAIFNPHILVQDPDEWVGPVNSNQPSTDEGCDTSYDEGGLVYMNGASGTGCYRTNQYHYSNSWSYFTASTGSFVSSTPGAAVTLEWACQQKQQVVITYCDNYSVPFRACWNSKESTPYTVPYSSGATAAGNSEFAGVKGVTGSAVVHPQTTTTYNLTCGTYPDNPWYWYALKNGSGEGHFVYSDIQNRTPSAMSITVNVIAPTPTLAITGNGSNPVSVAVGQAVTVAATYAAGTGDTLAKTAINDYQNNLWCGSGAICNQSMWTASPLGSKSYTFTPSASGDYVFYPAAQSTQYPSWNNYTQSLIVHVSATPTCSNGLDYATYGPACTCPNGQSQQPAGSSTCTANVCSNGLDYATYGPACVCPNGQSQQPAGSSTCTPSPTCSNGLDYASYGPGCTCPNNQHQSGSVCVPDICSNGLDYATYGPACTCPSGQTQQPPGASTCTANPPSLSAFTASPARVRASIATPVTFSWSGANLPAGGCSIVGTSVNISGAASPRTVTVTIAQSAVFTLTCGSVSRTTTVGILPTFQEI